MTPPREDETARMGLEWVREDVKECREAIEANTKKLGELTGLVSSYSRSLDEHVRDCPVRNKKNSSTTIMPPKGASLFMYARALAPLLLTIAIALIALGAYWGRTGDIEQNMKKLEAAVAAMKVVTP